MSGPERRPRSKSSQINPYAPSCALRTRVQMCEPYMATSDCAECTSTARCGSGRNVYSRYRRSHGFSSARGAAPSSPRSAKPIGASTAPVDRLDVRRSRDGLAAHYNLLAATTDAVSFSGGRWLFDESSDSLQVELIVPKDQYETPAEIWRAAVRMFGLDRDSHASPRHQVAEPAGPFLCSTIADPTRASCGAPSLVWRPIDGRPEGGMSIRYHMSAPRSERARARPRRRRLQLPRIRTSPHKYIHLNNNILYSMYFIRKYRIPNTVK